MQPSAAAENGPVFSGYFTELFAKTFDHNYFVEKREMRQSCAQCIKAVNLKKLNNL